MSTQDLGRVLLNFVGDWSSKKDYKALDVVLKDGSSYVALKDNTFTEVTTTDVWQLMAKSGEFKVGEDDLDSAVRRNIAKINSYRAASFIVKGGVPTIEFHFNNSDRATSTIRETKAGTLEVFGDVKVSGTLSANNISGGSGSGQPGPAGKDGAPGKDGKDGAPGKDGKDGKDGTSVPRQVTFTDWATVASDMLTYDGDWYTQGTQVANSPETGMEYSNFTVTAGNGHSIGRIFAHNPFSGNSYIGNVWGGEMHGWTLISSKGKDGAVGPVGPQGPQGIQGLPGVDGKDANNTETERINPTIDRFSNSYHFDMPIPGIMGGVQGALYIDGVWNVFFTAKQGAQYFNGTIVDDNGFGWHRATTRDFAKWDYEGCVIYPKMNAISDGSVYQDKDNDLGYGNNALIIFTSSYSEDSQSHRVMPYVSTDNGLTFEYTGRVLVSIKQPKNIPLDPYFFKRDGKYCLYVCTDSGIRVYNSYTALGAFTNRGTFQTSVGASRKPCLYEMQVNGDAGNKRWVLLYSADEGSDKLTMGTYAAVGTLDSNSFFQAEQDGIRVDLGPDFYSSQLFVDAANEDPTKNLFLIGTQVNPLYAGKYRTDGRFGSLSLVRRIRLDNHNGKYVLISEYQGIRPDYLGIPVTATLNSNNRLLPILSGDAFYLAVQQINMGNYQGKSAVIVYGKGFDFTFTFDYKAKLVEVRRHSDVFPDNGDYNQSRVFPFGRLDDNPWLYLYVDRTFVEALLPSGEVYTMMKLADGETIHHDVRLTSDSPLDWAYEYYQVAPRIIDSNYNAKNTGTLYSTEHVQKRHLNTDQGWGNDLQTIVWNPDNKNYDVYFLHSADGAMNVFGEKGQNWNHATTTDFENFSIQNDAIAAHGPEGPFTYKSAWTGAVIRNTGNIKGVPVGAPVAFFSGLMKGDGSQNIWAAWSSNKGKTFTNVLNDAKPILDHSWDWTSKNHADLRDPSVFYKGDTLYMYASEAEDIGVYRSKDGINWEQSGKNSKISPDVFFKGHPWKDNAPIECPAVRTMKSPNGTTKTVLFFGAKDGSQNQTCGTYFIVGSLDSDMVFVPETEAKQLDYGTDYYGSNFLGVDSIDTVSDSLITMSWCGNWNWTASGIRADTLPQGKPALRLGSYTTARKVVLNDDMTMSQTPLYGTTAKSVQSIVTTDAKEAPSALGDGTFYDLLTLTDESPNTVYDLGINSQYNSTIREVLIEVRQDANYVKIKFDPITGMLSVNSYAPALNDGANQLYMTKRVIQTRYQPKDGFSAKVITDVSSLELFLPTGEVYTVARFSIRETQSVRVTCQNLRLPKDANTLRLTKRIM